MDLVSINLLNVFRDKTNLCWYLARDVTSGIRDVTSGVRADVGIWHALWYAALSWHMDTL